MVDEHVDPGSIGISAPAWYFAPQRPAVGLAGWHATAGSSGVLGDGPILGLELPARATTLLQLAGEFADPATKRRIWEAAEHYIEPNWDHDSGEFTLGFGLNEAQPRGQLNARTMAGWVCTEGAWSKIFNQPNLAKFDQPTVVGVDFPHFALSEARWDGAALHVAIHPHNISGQGKLTRFQLDNVASSEGWEMTTSDGQKSALSGANHRVDVELVADNQIAVIRQV